MTGEKQASLMEVLAAAVLVHDLHMHELTHSQRGKCCAGQITRYTCNRQRSMLSKKYRLPLI